MCQRQAIFLKVTEIKKRLGECDIIQKRGEANCIKIRPEDLNDEKLAYLNEIAIIDDTVHSKSEMRWRVKWGIIIEKDELQ